MNAFNKKFVFSETFTNENGKTSGSGFVGVVLGMVAAISFIIAMVGYLFKFPETIPVMEKIIEIIMAVTVLLGVRKVSGDLLTTKKIAAAKQEPPTDPDVA